MNIFEMIMLIICGGLFCCAPFFLMDLQNHDLEQWKKDLEEYDNDPDVQGRYSRYLQNRIKHSEQYFGVESE